ncbi:Uncharacterized membrane protein YpjA [Halorientalis persicus]|uniref:Uncharacterized membrane protein YpjA n=1 Tax=Halorientalis persicus TaxID=1367881 RepID=A0A1H8Q9Q7_9EURY|nr:DUF1405 domain-containing protein [Halorientalis persicus]SEO50647.1 Uncharacterized membrane protein YpjA [Halorientalis persicus]
MDTEQTDGWSRFLGPPIRRVENVALEYAWVIVGINLLGTVFGFWYYIPQFRLEPLAAWPVVPDSPMATLFIALSLALYKLERPNEYLNVLAFFGCLKLGLWTPYVLTVFADAFLATVMAPPQIVPLLGQALSSKAMYGFLFVSHLGMAAEAFLVRRYSAFPSRAILVAVVWYGFNDLVDYFVPIVGTPHHTLLPVEPIVDGTVQHVSPAHEIAAAGAVVLTMLATVLTVVIHQMSGQTSTD